MVLVATWWYWVSNTDSVWGETVWFLVILGQYSVVLVGTWWYWVSIGWCWLIYDGTGSV